MVANANISTIVQLYSGGVHHLEANRSLYNLFQKKTRNNDMFALKIQLSLISVFDMVQSGYIHCK